MSKRNFRRDKKSDPRKKRAKFDQDIDRSTSIIDLPVHVLLKIIMHLPLRERIRVGRVGQIFRRVSQLSVANTKSLKLNNATWKKMGPRVLRSILDACAKNLKRVSLKSEHYRRYNQRILDIFVEYSFPRLLTFKSACEIRGDLLARLLEKSPNLRRLECECDNAVFFPSAILHRLEIVDLSWCDGGTLRSMIGKVPNLKRLDISCWPLPTVLLEEFFRNAPNLQVLSMSEADFRVASFWKLQWLLELNIRQDHAGPVDDRFLENIGQSFHRLQTLSVFGKAAVTAAGVGALGALTELEHLSLYLRVSFDGDIDAALQNLVNCTRLRFVSIHCVMPAAAIATLIRNCPKLEYLFIDRFRKSEKPEVVVTALASLAGSVLVDVDGARFPFREAYEHFLTRYRKSEVKYAFRKYGDYSRRITISSGKNHVWTSPSVKAILKKLKSDGLFIEISV